MRPRMQARAVGWIAIILAFSLIGGVAAGAEQNGETLRLPMSDLAISDKIDDELVLDPGVVSTQIDVLTSDGIVTLSGQVDNLLAKQRATRVAEAVKGVRAVINKIEVAPAPNLSDDVIARNVEKALIADPAVEAYEVAATVDDGRVTLTGTVDSFQESDLVVQVVKGVRGVRAVHDRVEVEFERDRPDFEILEEINKVLRWNVYVDDHLIDVEVSQGRATLSGAVGSASEKRLARRLARVEGVVAVDDAKLKVERWARDKELRGDKYVIKSEKELRNAIEDALLYDPRTLEFDIEVDVVGSVVTLRGEVDNLRAKRAAERDARNTVGVSAVNNRLKVRPPERRPDEEIESQVREAFDRDPYIRRFDVAVSVVNGSVYLYGDVDSEFERQRAESLAARFNGVLAVNNFLDVDDDSYYFYDPYIDNDYTADNGLQDNRPSAPAKPDAEIQEAIETELWWSPFVDSDDVEVSVDNGVATLAGKVQSAGERRSAIENAYEGGATQVDDDLQVERD